LLVEGQKCSKKKVCVHVVKAMTLEVKTNGRNLKTKDMRPRPVLEDYITCGTILFIFCNEFE
jgi:hypothetical protein